MDLGFYVLGVVVITLLSLFLSAEFSNDASWVLYRQIIGGILGITIIGAIGTKLIYEFLN